MITARSIWFERTAGSAEARAVLREEPLRVGVFAEPTLRRALRALGDSSSPVRGGKRLRGNLHGRHGGLERCPIVTCGHLQDGERRQAARHVRMRIARITLPKGVQGAIDDAQAQFAAVNGARAELRQAQYRAERNRLLGEERLISFDQPGTTRDAVFVPFERDGQTYTLIDTAGVRRRARVEEAIEKFSVIKALQAVDSANVVIGVGDNGLDTTHRDLRGRLWSAPTEFTVTVGGQPLTCPQGSHGFYSVNGVLACDAMYRGFDPHATHVTGIAAAAGDNGVDATGVNWNSSVLALTFGEGGSARKQDAAGVAAG